MQFCRKQIINILGPDLCNASAVQLLPCSRPVTSPGGTVDGFVLAPVDANGSPIPASANPLTPSIGRQQPGASTSTASSSDSDDGAGGGGGGGTQLPRGVKPTTTLLRHAAELDPSLQQLIDVAATIAVQHPADCERAELRLYLGKVVVCDLNTSARSLPPEALLGWTYPQNGRMVFESSLPQDTIRSLDRYLTSRGLVPTQQLKSASLHLESSIPWIQYHPTFTVAADGQMTLSKLETLGCKPLTVALMGGPETTDVRLRFVASVQHGEEDPVAAELRRRQGEFTLVNNVQVTIPNDLDSLDLTLTSARVKLKRVYASVAPLPPPAAEPTPAITAAAAAAASSPGTRRPRATKHTAAAAAAAAAAAVAAAPAEPPLPAVSLKVSVAAVVDNLGGKRLEVTVSCPEINALLMGLHRERAEAPGAREQLAAQLRSLLAHVEDLRRNVEFVH